MIDSTSFTYDTKPEHFVDNDSELLSAIDKSRINKYP